MTIIFHIIGYLDNFFGEIPIQIFCPFLKWVVFLLLSYMSSLHIVDTSLSQMCYLQIYYSIAFFSFLVALFEAHMV